MTDTRTLLNTITAFRQRLESMPRLISRPLPRPAPAPADAPGATLIEKVAAGSRTQAILEDSIRQLSEEPAPAQPAPTHLIAKAKRILIEAHELVNCLRRLADDVLLAGPPPEQGSVEADPLAIFYRETAAMMVPAVRLAHGMPDTPSVQSRLADGLDGIFATVRQRLAALGHALDLRRRDAEQVERLAQLLVGLTSGETPLEAEPFTHLASQVLAEGPAVPMRFLYTPPAARQSYLGGTEFPAPARFVASHSLTTARVAARMLRQAPEWRDRPLDVIVAALIHDVGMLRVPAELLASSAPLTDDQRRTLEAHARAGSEIVAYRLPSLAHLAEVVMAHHERLDGTGYPSGLKADQVPPLARFIAAADMYAALCCPRAHRGALDPRTALTDTLLYGEQNIIDRFAAEKLLALSFYPVGSVVEMSDGAIGVVAANRQARDELHLAARPVLNLLIDAQGRLLPVPLPVDLAECEGGGVVRTLRGDERARLLGRHFPEWAA
jgi:HD-GYP domain-containing protein (c-di-GMP phosphodiesterase class II)